MHCNLANLLLISQAGNCQAKGFLPADNYTTISIISRCFVPGLKGLSDWMRGDPEQ